MTSEQRNNQQEILPKLEAGCRKFLEQFGYTTELGVFSGSWKIYKDLPLDQFEEAKPKQDRMLLPGMETDPDLLDSIIRTFAAIWQFARRSEMKLTVAYLSTLSSQEALRLGASSALAKQLAEFLPAYCIKEFEDE